MATIPQKMRFGVLGARVEIPWPHSGMGMDGNTTAESNELASGGQSIYRAPTSFKSYSMSWSGGTDGLGPLRDVYDGMYGRGPFYLTDPLSIGRNMLPPRWASSYMLVHTSNGWGNAATAIQTNTPERRQAVFNRVAGDPVLGQSVVVAAVPEQPLYLTAHGYVTGGAAITVEVFENASMSWIERSSYVPTEAPTPAVLLNPSETTSDYDAVRLTLSLPDNSSLALQHMDVSTIAPDSIRGGIGVGPVQFTGNIGGTLTSATIDRIGLTVDIREVQRDPNNQ